MANSFAAGNKIEAHGAWEKAETRLPLEILSSRYQAVADSYTTGNQDETIHALATISLRYQAQAEMYQAQEE